MCSRAQVWRISSLPLKPKPAGSLFGTVQESPGPWLSSGRLAKGAQRVRSAPIERRIRSVVEGVQPACRNTLRPLLARLKRKWRSRRLTWPLRPKAEASLTLAGLQGPPWFQAPRNSWPGLPSRPSRRKVPARAVEKSVPLRLVRGLGDGGVAEGDRGNQLAGDHPQLIVEEVLNEEVVVELGAAVGPGAVGDGSVAERSGHPARQEERLRDAGKLAVVLRTLLNRHEHITGGGPQVGGGPGFLACPFHEPLAGAIAAQRHEQGCPLP